jgi:hypothetical protein
MSASVSAVAAQARCALVPYRNDRFGFQLQIPADVFIKHRAADAGDGDSKNVDRYSPASYQRFLAHQSYPGLHIDYAPVGGSWAVLSGTQGSRMVYEKVMFTCGGHVINSFALVYPIAERDVFDPIMEAMEDSFRAGSIRCGAHASAN